MADPFTDVFRALGKADLMKTNKLLGIDDIGLDKDASSLTEDELRAKQLELLKQQIEAADATKAQNAQAWGTTGEDLFGSGYGAPPAPAPVAAAPVATPAPTGARVPTNFTPQGPIQAASQNQYNDPAFVPQGGITSGSQNGYTPPPAPAAGSISFGDSLKNLGNKVNSVRTDQPAKSKLASKIESANAANPSPVSRYTPVQGHVGEMPAAPVSRGFLGNAYDRANTADDAALNDFKALLGGIKDPAIADYVGDMESQAQFAGADPADIAAQTQARDRFRGLSDLQETPEEKLMREISRRNQEQDLKSQRGAMKNSLLARGAYGSGAEIGMSLGAQQEAASRRQMEELGANANAQQRAMAALGQFGALSSSMRGASAGESQFRGTASDKAAAFNKGLKQQDDQFRTKTLMDQNKDIATRGGAAFDASRVTTGGQASRASDEANKKIAFTSGKTGSALAAGSNPAVDKLGNFYGTQADLKHEEDESDTPFGSLGWF